MSNKIAFLLILVIFVLLYASITLHIPLLGYVGVIAYALIVVSQIIKV